MVKPIETDYVTEANIRHGQIGEWSGTIALTADLDISPDIIKIGVVRERMEIRQPGIPQSGSFTIELKNDNDQYSPTNTDSFLYGEDYIDAEITIYHRFSTTSRIVYLSGYISDIVINSKGTAILTVKDRSHKVLKTTIYGSPSHPNTADYPYADNRNPAWIANNLLLEQADLVWYMSFSGNDYYVWSIEYDDLFGIEAAADWSEQTFGLGEALRQCLIAGVGVIYSNLDEDLLGNITNMIKLSPRWHWQGGLPQPAVNFFHGDSFGSRVNCNKLTLTQSKDQLANAIFIDTKSVQAGLLDIDSITDFGQVDMKFSIPDIDIGEDGDGSPTGNDTTELCSIYSNLYATIPPLEVSFNALWVDNACRLEVGDYVSIQSERPYLTKTLFRIRSLTSNPNRKTIKIDAIHLDQNLVTYTWDGSDWVESTREVVDYDWNASFDSDESQDIAASGDGRVDYGWYADNTANTDDFDVDNTNTGMLTIDPDTTITKWWDADRDGPYLHKIIGGSFDVWTEISSVTSPQSGLRAGILIQENSDDSEWAYISKYRAGANWNVSVVTTESDVSTTRYNAVNSDSFLRIVYNKSVTLGTTVIGFYSKANLEDDWTLRWDNSAAGTVLGSYDSKAGLFVANHAGTNVGDVEFENFTRTGYFDITD